VTRRWEEEEFVGYTFQGSPEHRPRLWFLDRHICLLIPDRHICLLLPTLIKPDIDVGTWSAFDSQSGHDEKALDGVCLRYDHHGEPTWTAVWQLTDITIPHVHTFGRDDTWRLGVWPD
jgi:hypothetical protein